MVPVIAPAKATDDDGWYGSSALSDGWTMSLFRISAASTSGSTRRNACTPNVKYLFAATPVRIIARLSRSEEHTSELQSLMRHSYAVFCLNKKKTTKNNLSRSHI